MISVIVPAYNYGHLLGETLNNISQQTYTDWECIIVDDGSTDQTAEIAGFWTQKDSRYRYIFQKNAGLSAARNTGINASKGAFIQLLDADDFLCPDKFRLQLRLFNQNPEADIIYSEVRYFTTEHPEARFHTLDCKEETWMPLSSSKNHKDLMLQLIQSNLFAVNCPLIRKSVFDKVGKFDVKLRSLEDWDYWCRCAFAGLFFHFDSSPESYALVRTHEGSMSRNKPVMLEAAVMVRKKLAKQIQNIQDIQLKSEIEIINKQNIAYSLKTLAELYHEQGNFFLFTNRLFEFVRIKGEYRYFLKELARVLGIV